MFTNLFAKAGAFVNKIKIKYQYSFDKQCLVGVYNSPYHK
jgi:hypothetical protein